MDYRMGISRWLILSGIFGVLLLGSLGILQARARADWQQKVDQAVLDTVVRDDHAEFLVILEAQANLARAARLDTKAAKGAYVYAQLTAVAKRTQGPIIAVLQAAGADYEPYWVSNMIWVRGDAQLLEQLARRGDVARIDANPSVQLDRIENATNKPDSAAEGSGVEWNIDHVGAPLVWSEGVTGQGVVIGGQDTGYDWEHPALKAQYRGWDGATADHAYSWHDAIHENNANTPAGNPCGFDTTAPCDDDGHGTHTMGTMVGDDGGTNQIGMAPGAKWIACRNMEQGWGTPATYAECYQWFIAPYPQGSDPLTDGDPSRAPDVISNSWSCPTVEGCTDPDVLHQVVDNVRAAGIVTVHAASNGGPACSTIDTPAAIYDASFTVAATGSTDDIAGFSSRGPVVVGENGAAKPDISAPGINVRSSIPGGGYGYKSGTSMATPHVAGLVALLISAKPELAGNVDGIENLIDQTAVTLYTTDGCGGDTSQSHPNHTFGWGRIDAYAAFLAVDTVDPEPTPTGTFTPIPTGSVETPTPTVTPQPSTTYRHYAPLLLGS